jgi:hypothetical protein
MRYRLSTTLALVVAAPFVAVAQTITITEPTCRNLIAHRASPDVAYTPGRDVQGRPVAPADLDGGIPLRMPESFSIAITVEIAKRFGIPTVPHLYKPEAMIGEVTYRDGRFWFNGQPLQSEAEATLSELCQRQLGSR